MIRIPLSWDSVGFDDMARVSAEALPSELQDLQLEVIRHSSAAWDNAPTRRRVSKQRAEAAQASHKQLSAEFARYSFKIRDSILERMNSLKSEVILGAIACLGAIPDVESGDKVGVPGIYDRELQWLSTLLVAGESVADPSWEDVCSLIDDARSFLLSRLLGSRPVSATDRIEDSVRVSAEYGAAYGPIAFGIARRLLDAVVVQDTALRRRFSLDVLGEVLRKTALRIESVLRQSGCPQDIGDDGFRRRLHAVVDRFSPRELVESFVIRGTICQDPTVRILTTRNDPGSPPPSPFLDRPFMSFDDGIVVMLPRRITCDIVELLDISLEKILGTSPAGASRYHELRASVLDGIVADSLGQILPGAEILRGQMWKIDERSYERDIVALYEDVAICVETKGSRIDPSAGKGWSGPVKQMRAHIRKGVEQATSLASALEDGRVSLENGSLATSSFRRAYPIVASMNTWWGADVAVSDLVEAGIMPSLDAAIVTSADKFEIYRILFRCPADFLAYLDFRMAYQRRNWIVVPDEYELLGCFFTNHDGRELELVPRDSCIQIKDVFQDDIRDTVLRVLEKREHQSLRLKHKRSPRFEEIVDNLLLLRPDGWLQAYSACVRLPLSEQVWIENECEVLRGSIVPEMFANDEPMRTYSERTLALQIVRSRASWNRLRWTRLLRSTELTRSIVVVEVRDRTELLAVRGVDDRSIWLSPDWLEVVAGEGPRREPEGRTSATRIQPRRRSRRLRRGNDAS